MEYRTKEFTLPVSGALCIVREADANAEYLLTGDKRVAEAFPDYWAYLTRQIGDIHRPTTSQFLDLLEPDRISIAIEIFRVTMGDELKLSGECAGCGEPVNYVVDLGELDFIPLPEGVSGPDPTFEIELPRSRHRVIWGFRTGHQEIEELRMKGFNPSRSVFRAIRSIDGNMDFKLHDVMAWPLMDHRALRNDIASKMVGYDTRVRFTHGCGRGQVVNILSDPSFLMPGLAGGLT